ncbi:phage resistance protein [Plantactinospora sp. S1510]|uniref:Phage resistance protein n=1 Tax=Plantactinospora alkalitolerans TaxID=2789879 RepID=A0ABS0GNB5_9ACTN|nr:phage resistance protein [Plantactinospora alkalitolerans]MBF9127685.1 phage resistance protein [Plantactinospora alkalitolerans]
MTLLRDLIDIPTSVGDGDFVVKAAEGADLHRYVVTDQLRENFTDAMRRIGHAVTTGRSQAMFLHGSFGSGKSHFMAVLREILEHNPGARQIHGLAEPIVAAESWLPGRKFFSLTCHMLDARSVEQAILEGYLRQVSVAHPEAPLPPVHRSDGLLDDAAAIRRGMGDEQFFAALRDGGTTPGTGGLNLSALRAQREGWTPERYAEAAAEPPGTKDRDALVSALTTTFFTGSVHSAEYLDLDTGLAVITRHAKALGYDALVFFLDELILWLSTKISDHTFVNTEGAKLNKLVESADAARPLPLISFIARQRNLEEFLGPQVGGTEREALAHVMRSVQGRLGEIVLADTNLPEITEKRLLKPNDDAARAVLDNAFGAVRHNREVWDTLLLGAQYGDAGIGSDATAFRQLYPFSPALVATLVALSQALQRERTALKVMTELLVDRRDILRVNDLIGVAALFDPLVLRGELPDRPKLKQMFTAARTLYQTKLRPILLTLNGITEERAATSSQFQLDDKLIKTLLLGALVPEVPALHNLTAAKLHALNFGSITAPIPGYENTVVLNRLKKIEQDAGELHLTDDRDPVVTLKLHTVDFDKLLDLVPNGETSAGVRQQLLRELISAELGLAGAEGAHGELLQPREWRGRRHYVQVKFGNVRDPDSMPIAALVSAGEGWRIVIDYPFDPRDYPRSDDRARIDTLPRGSNTVFWLPLYFTDDMMARVAQLAKINYLLGTGGNGDRLNTLAADWPQSDRQQGKVYLQQRQSQLRDGILTALKQAYGAANPQASDVQEDSVGVLHTLADGLRIGDPRGGTLADAFHNLTGELLEWSYPGTPTLPVDEKPLTRAELTKVLDYARLAAADPTNGVAVSTPADQRILRRICNNLQLGEMIDHRYVLEIGTCFWSRHLLQEAAKHDYRKHFPVSLLRELLDQPKKRGFDRDLQNLIIAVFALQQQLGWYHDDDKVSVAGIGGVEDRFTLREPPMPSEDDWRKAVQFGQPFFGTVLPIWRSPTNLGPLAADLRQVAKQYVGSATQLVNELTGHADLLGLDPGAATGRLSTARRVARLLENVAAETDDVVLVGLVARADLGEVEPLGASEVFKKADSLIRALAGTQWPMLAAIVRRAVDDDRARVIIEQLRIAANHEQHAMDLADALRRAVADAAALLAEQTPKPPIVDPLPPVHPPVEPPIVPPVAPGGTTPKLPPVDPTDPDPHRELVASEEQWRTVAGQIEAEVKAGRQVVVTWQVQPAQQDPEVS